MAGLRKYKSLYSSTSSSFGTGESVTITPASVVGLPTTPIVLTFDRVGSDGTTLTPTKMERILGSVSAGNFVVASGGRGYDGSTEQAHTSPVVEQIWNAKDWNDTVDALTNVVDVNTGALDTTKVADLTTAQTLTNKTLISPLFQGTVDSWILANETWTYDSDHTVNTPAGGASKRAVGDRVKFTQTTVKYFVVTAVADTLLTFAVNTDFVVTDAAITLNYYSHEASPIGYPHWFNYSPTITWTAGTAPSGTPTKYERYYIVGNICTVNIHNFSYTAGETVTGATITTPVSPNGFFAAYGAITSGVTPNLSLADVTNGGGGRLFCTSVSANRIKFGASFKF